MHPATRWCRAAGRVRRLSAPPLPEAEVLSQRRPAGRRSDPAAPWRQDRHRRPASCWWWIPPGRQHPALRLRRVSRTWPPPPAFKAAGTRTGGRLVCLTDGREYTVGTRPLVVRAGTPDPMSWWRGTTSPASTPRSGTSRGVRSGRPQRERHLREWRADREDAGVWRGRT